MKTFLIPLACFFVGFVLGGFVSALCSMRSFTEQCEQCIKKLNLETGRAEFWRNVYTRSLNKKIESDN